MRVRTWAGRLGEVLAVPEIGGEGAGDRGHRGGIGGDQAELTVAVQRGAREVLRADEHLRMGGAVVRLDDLPVNVKAGRGAVVADSDTSAGQLAVRAVVFAVRVLPADLYLHAALGRGDQRLLHRGVTHLLAVDAQVAG